MTNKLIAAALLSALLIGQAAYAGDPAAPTIPVAQTPEQALARLLATSPQAKHQAIPLDGSPALITGLSVPTTGATWDARARHFLAAFPVLPASLDTLRVVETRSASGRHSVMFAQTVGGLHVWERSAVVTMDDAGRVLTLTSSLIRVEAVARGGVDEQAARIAAARAVLGPKADASVTKQAAQVLIAQPGSAEQVWMVSLDAFSPTLMRPLVFVSAVTGQVLAIRDHSMR